MLDLKYIWVLILINRYIPEALEDEEMRNALKRMALVPWHQELYYIRSRKTRYFQKDLLDHAPFLYMLSHAMYITL